MDPAELVAGGSYGRVDRGGDHHSGRRGRDAAGELARGRGDHPGGGLLGHGGAGGRRRGRGQKAGDAAVAEIIGQSELSRKVQKSIERLKLFEPPEGYYLAFYGGKDSVVCKRLLDMAGVKYDATYRITSVDPPELVQFIKDKHPDVRREWPRYKDGSIVTMWNLIPKKLMPPTRIQRYCCHDLKEDGGDGRMCVTGVRWDESVNRRKNQGIVTMMNKKMTDELDDLGFFANNRGGVVLVNDNDASRRMVEQCYKRGKTNLNPIIDWTDREIWDFIHAENVPYCGVYDEGYHRLGCIGCPMAGKERRARDFRRWPIYKALYMKALDRMIEERRKKNRPAWRCNGMDQENATARDIFRWWMEDDSVPGQMEIEDIMEDENDI